MNNDILNEWNPWWSGKQESSLVDRNLKKGIVKVIERKEIVGILGVRRSGKTTLMHLIIEHLLRSVGPENILFIKCDDERTQKEEMISNAIEMYREIKNPEGRFFVFIDEIQEVPGWEASLKRIYDL